MLKFISNNEDETKAIGFNLASKLNKKDIVILTGDLGSGKTMFTKGFAHAMGIDDITSPTFTIIKEYVGELPLYHMDVYRLEDSHEDIGIEEYFDKGGVTIIEWADMIKDILPEERLDIKIKIADDNTRILILKPHGEKYVNICEAII